MLLDKAYEKYKKAASVEEKFENMVEKRRLSKQEIEFLLQSINDIYNSNCAAVFSNLLYPFSDAVYASDELLAISNLEFKPIEHPAWVDLIDAAYEKNCKLAPAGLIERTPASIDFNGFIENNKSLKTMTLDQQFFLLYASANYHGDISNSTAIICIDWLAKKPFLNLPEESYWIETFKKGFDKLSSNHDTNR